MGGSPPPPPQKPRSLHSAEGKELLVFLLLVLFVVLLLLALVIYAIVALYYFRGSHEMVTATIVRAAQAVVADDFGSSGGSVVSRYWVTYLVAGIVYENGITVFTDATPLPLNTQLSVFYNTRIPSSCIYDIPPVWPLWVVFAVLCTIILFLCIASCKVAWRMWGHAWLISKEEDATRIV